ncbi:putative transcriptional regulator, AsnC family [Methanohalobium evestigatum Z-7303]|uniref:siroheme decarboxylase n=2 Tax=root TaxID=1 RepID=D7E6D4_METEZ|nr:siroheme decarboxylase subunit beta [Methanohalobium evestigatum]ADI73156.1 putative transcriptional regulator, AsnC family [Methanohalobium evestigatum Z-7303]AGF93253.1 AsnC family transcriptional regulator [uncultured organism]
MSDETSNNSSCYIDNKDNIYTKIIKLTQDGIPFTHSPFAQIASYLGISEDEVINIIKEMENKGIIRRFGASIGHRAIGITANAMCIWNVPDEKVEEVGAIMAGFSEVTHCYERPRYPDWPYNLFTMVHSYSKRDCEYVAEEISKATGITDYKLLFSEHEFKKTGVRL